MDCTKCHEPLVKTSWDIDTGDATWLCHNCRAEYRLDYNDCPVVEWPARKSTDSTRPTPGHELDDPTNVMRRDYEVGNWDDNPWSRM